MVAGPFGRHFPPVVNYESDFVADSATFPLLLWWYSEQGFVSFRLIDSSNPRYELNSSDC